MKKRIFKTLSYIMTMGLAGSVLLGSSIQSNAATLKDVFDEHYYADTYPDLKAVFGYDREALWNHFVTFGLNESRNMNGFINVVEYRKNYEDLNAAFGDDWNAYLNHYLTFGAKEGRNTGSNFDALDYAARYEDLQAAYGDDVLGLWKHYKENGEKEGREARDETIVEAEKQVEEIPATDTDNIDQQPGTSGGYTERIDNGEIGWTINEYNEAGERIKSTNYDTNGNIIYYSIPVYTNGKMTGATTYHPDGRYGITEYDENERQVKYTSYLAGGRLAYIHDYKTGMWSYYDYDENGVLKKVRDEFGSGPRKQLRKETFYDADGNIEYYTIYKYKNGELQKTESYNADGSVR